MKTITSILCILCSSAILCAQSQSSGSTKSSSGPAMHQPSGSGQKNQNGSMKRTNPSTGNPSGHPSSPPANVKKAPPATTGTAENTSMKNKSPQGNTSGNHPKVRTLKETCYWQCPKCKRIFHEEKDYCPYDSLVHTIKHCEPVAKK
jgi:uncharacterized C2H2 Zn-finger protein